MVKVLIFGDSITQGFWDSEGGWVQRIRETYDTLQIQNPEPEQPIVFNCGISGETTDDVLKRFDVETIARKRKDKVAIVFAFGVNDSRVDGKQNYSNVERYENNLKQLLEKARVHTEKVLFVGLTPCVEIRTIPVSWIDISYTDERVKLFDDALQRFCQEQRVPYVSIFEKMAQQQQAGELLPDGIHPNNEGHQLMADLIKPALDKLLNA